MKPAHNCLCVAYTALQYNSIEYCRERVIHSAKSVAITFRNGNLCCRYSDIPGLIKTITPLQYSVKLYQVNGGKPAIRCMEEDYSNEIDERTEPTPTIAELEASLPPDEEADAVAPKCICSQRSGLLLDDHQLNLEKFEDVVEGEKRRKKDMNG